MQSSQKIDAVFFDLDGTMIDSEGLASKAIRECLKTRGLVFKPEMDALIIGKKWESALVELIRVFPSLKGQEAELYAEIVRLYAASLKREVVPIPGIVEAVKELSQHIPLALVSGSLRSDILFALDKLGVTSCFQEILGSEDYGSSKPSPEGYLEAISRLSVDPARCLVFEDSNPGVRSAKRAGLKVAAILHANYGQDVSEADVQVRDFRGITHEWVVKAVYGVALH